jgi:purine-binding chemotaxis protein CheW
VSDQLKQVFQKQQEQSTPTEQSDDIIQLVGFIVGDEEFAVPILSIQEIIKPIEYTRVPSTPNFVLGVFNLRGNVIPLINLRMKFRLQAQKENDDTRYIVIKHGEDTAGFVIDRLTEALRIRESNIDPAPEAIKGNDDMIYGVGKKDDRIITILKVEALLKRTF